MEKLAQATASMIEFQKNLTEYDAPADHLINIYYLYQLAKELLDTKTNQIRIRLVIVKQSSNAEKTGSKFHFTTILTVGDETFSPTLQKIDFPQHPVQTYKAKERALEKLLVKLNFEEHQNQKIRVEYYDMMKTINNIMLDRLDLAPNSRKYYDEMNEFVQSKI